MSKKINCIIRDKEIIATPEEIVRQQFINILMEDYNYLKEDIRVEYGTKKAPSDSRGTYPIDIAVMEYGKPKIFIETKKENDKTKDGLTQLKIYMSLNPDVVWGIWTNGIEKLFLKKNTHNLSSVEVFDIPKKSFNEVQSQLKSCDLISSNNLQFQFKNIRSFISGDSVGTTRDEKIASELIKIVLCKTYDEKFTAEEEHLEFYHEHDLEKETAKRIKDIYEKVKQKYRDVFKQADKITLDARSISYCVSQLQKYSLTGSDRNVISDAFETIIGHSLKGSQGQFFTPKNIVQLIVSIIKPSCHEKIIDPAVGSGGFLIEAMLYNWNIYSKFNLSELAIFEEQKDYALKNLFGIEKDDFLGQICKSYMAVLGDGKSGIFIDNSLENPKNWRNQSIQLGTFDLLLTNPPFGKDIKMSKEIAANYQSDKVDIAFLERSLSFLKEKGRLAIILSEVVFHAPTYKKFRDSLIYKHNITHLIDLPHDTFRPFNNAKCIVLMLQKNQPQQDKITLINLKKIGHDHKGSPTYEYDYVNSLYKSNILDDAKDLITAFNDNSNNGNLDKDNVLEVNSQKIINNDILVPRYYFNSNVLTNRHSVEIGKLIEEEILESFEGHGSPEAHLKGKGEVPYIRVKDICNLEVVINDIDGIPEINASTFRKSSPEIIAKDIIMVRRGSYRIGDVGFVYPKDLKSIYTKELQFFRVLKKNDYGITQNNLLLLLNSKSVKEQIKNLTFLDTTLPTLYKRWKKIKVPLHNLQEMKDLDNKAEKCYELRNKFWNQIK